ncbi:50S ribosomal protein L24 [Candidatus Shapirobacteria bacterium]|nr:50S ribosomal protein L24 [Candidatus Shapirobacteria bacterium]
MKLHKGDIVKVLIGKDKGREGEILQAFPKKGQVLVKGLNIFKKHLKATQNQAGSIIQKERPFVTSKVALVCPQCKKTTRVGYQIDKEGNKYRVCKKCHQLINTKTK